jgi:hypothetical protein
MSFVTIAEPFTKEKIVAMHRTLPCVSVLDARENRSQFGPKTKFD